MFAMPFDLLRSPQLCATPTDHSLRSECRANAVHAQPENTALPPAQAAPPSQASRARPQSFISDTPGDATTGPEIVCQSTATPVVEAILSATLSCGVHETLDPAATYSTGCTAAAVLTCANARTKTSSYHQLLLPATVISPAVSGSDQRRSNSLAHWSASGTPPLHKLQTERCQSSR